MYLDTEADLHRTEHHARTQFANRFGWQYAGVDEPAAERLMSGHWRHLVPRDHHQIRFVSIRTLLWRGLSRLRHATPQNQSGARRVA